MKKLAFFSLISIQLIIVIFLVEKIYKNRNNILGTTIKTTLHAENYLSNPDSELKYFFEPKANTSEKRKVPSSTTIVESTLNSDHLYERYDYSVPKPPGTYRIITLGDSFTMGLFTKTADSYPEILEDMASNSCSKDQRVEIINLGVAGYDIEYSVERYFLRGGKYDPDAIVFLLKEDDFIDIAELTLPGIQKLNAEMGPEKVSQLAEIGQAPQLNEVYTEIRGKYGEKHIEDYQRKQLERLILNFKGKIVFPIWYDTSTKYKQLIKDLAEKYFDQVSYLELPDYYSIDPKNKQSDWHPTPLGYERLAETIFEYLVSKSLMPCD